VRARCSFLSSGPNTEVGRTAFCPPVREAAVVLAVAVGVLRLAVAALLLIVAFCNSNKQQGGP
jgi:hypothetical protein